MSGHMKDALTRIEVYDLAPFYQALNQIRRQIDLIDSEIIELVAKRATLSKHALALKAEYGVCLHSPRREQEILERVKSLATSHGFDSLVAEHIFMPLLRQYVGPGSGIVVNPVTHNE